MDNLAHRSFDVAAWRRQTQQFIEQKEQLIKAKDSQRLEALFDAASRRLYLDRSQLCESLAPRLRRGSPHSREARKAARQLVHLYYEMNHKHNASAACEHFTAQLVATVNALGLHLLHKLSSDDDSAAHVGLDEDSDSTLCLEARSRMLIELGAPLDQQGPALFPPLYEALIYDRLELATQLVLAGADVNCAINDKSLLARASARGFGSAVDFLLQHGADPNGRLSDGSCGRPPLICALRGAHASIASKLIQYGAKVDIHEKDSCDTPLRLAAFLNDERLVAQLLNVGAEPSFASAGDPGMDILLFAAIYNNCAMLEQLLATGVYDTESAHREILPLAYHYAQRYAATAVLSFLDKYFVSAADRVDRYTKKQTVCIVPFPSMHQPRYDQELRNAACAENALRLMAHALHLKGSISPLCIQHGWTSLHLAPAVDLMGHVSQATLRMMGQTWDLFCSQPERLQGLNPACARQIRYALFRAAHMHSVSGARARFVRQAASPERASIVPLGHESHATAQVLWKGYSVYCNRGCLGFPGGALFKRWRGQDKPTEQLFCLSASQDLLFEESYQELRDSFLDGLESDKTCELLTELCTLPKQKVGNCTWTSMEMALLALLTIAFLPPRLQESDPATLTEHMETAVSSAKRVFSAWQVFSIVRCIQEVIRPEGALEQAAYVLSPGLVAELFEQIRQLPHARPELKEQITRLEQDYAQRMPGPTYRAVKCFNRALPYIQAASETFKWAKAAACAQLASWALNYRGLSL